MLNFGTPEAERAAPEAEAARVARRLVANGRRRFGFIALSSGGSVHETVCSVAASLCDLTNEPAVAIDAAATWPIWTSDMGAANGSALLGRWLHGARVAALRPAVPPAPGDAVAALDSLLEHAKRRASYALVDLSGLRATGEHLGAFTLVDGVCLVARAGKTRERDLLELNAELDPSKNLGVLLIGI